MKKVFLALILIFAFASNGFCSTAVKAGFVNYQEYGSNRAESIIILPLDSDYFSSYVSTYSSILNRMGSDIVNLMNETTSFKAMPLDEFAYKVERNRLEPELRRVITAYKTKGIIDYRTLGIICNAMGAKEVILITGDFNSFKFAISPHPANSLDVLEPAIIKPAFTINTMITLVDPLAQLILWQETYSKKFTVDTPQTDFEHNAVSLKCMQRFSQSTASNVILNVNSILEPTEPVTSTQSDTIKSNPNLSPKDGVTTKDGHLISAPNRLVKPLRLLNQSN
ncbi:MAG: hypothetical protein PHE78_04805 [Candidatus Gastranaerophilales bacterium]|nr:hypothetical protein [Candidatus Gastranaerophilales bacterium]